jgi:sulfatase modifying factor 1
MEAAKAMKHHRLLKLIGLIAGLTALVIVGLQAPTWIAFTQGEQAAARQRWPEAFERFWGIFDRDPGYRDVAERCADAARRSIAAIPDDIDLSTQVNLIRMLARLDDREGLTEALDRSLAQVPAGEFPMGSDDARSDERPRHLVSLDAFEIDRFEVANAQYQRFLQATGRQGPRYWSGDEYPAGQSEYPVVGISWSDAEAYCAWASRRLPTEAEWEKACRGTDGRLYPWGEDWDSRQANVGQSPLEPSGDFIDALWPVLLSPASGPEAFGLRPVGSYPDGASSYGVMDLVGNVSEWVADRYNWEGYQDLPAANPLNQEPPWNWSVRGSSWFNRPGPVDEVAEGSRCSARNSSHSSDDPRVGFRCARSLR